MMAHQHTFLFVISAASMMAVTGLVMMLVRSHAAQKAGQTRRAELRGAHQIKRTAYRRAWDWLMGRPRTLRIGHMAADGEQD